MRWEELFADLEGQHEQMARRERELEVAEHTRAERGQITLADRLVAAEGRRIRVRVSGVGWLDTTLRDVGTDWVLLGRGEIERRATGRDEMLVPTAAVTAVQGLPRGPSGGELGGRRLGLRHALRGVSQDRAPVRVHDREGDHLTGTVDAVLADHLDLSLHADDAPRRASAVRGVVSVPYATLAMVRRL